MTIRRRLAAALAAALLSAASPGLAAQAQPAAPTAAAPEWRHSLSLLDAPKYPPDFKHFEYVNPQAPKGGVARLSAFGTYDTLNPILPNGTAATGLGLAYETLMTLSFDEVGASYGLLAEAVRLPPDYAWVSYRLRPQARWHDGQPVTPEDVVFSFDIQKEVDPQRAFYYRHVVKAEKTGEREITFTFDAPGNRELPQIVGELLILPKHYWEGTDPNGQKRNIRAGTLDAPLGSGPYRIKTPIVPGRTIAYERVPDYWARDLPVNVGKNNFDEVRYEYYRDQTVLLEAFKADQYDFREENSARNWATAYDFPAAREKRVVLDTHPETSSGIMQGFVFNLRRDKFKDPRVRLAFNYAFDFEEMNDALFYGQYQRIDSYFERTELASKGLPQGGELEILNEVKEGVPAEVFTKEFQNPKGGNPRLSRQNLREAQRLLEEAGWEIRGGKLTNKASGEVMNVEYLSADPNFERVILRYQQSLERLGISVSVRVVDVSQYVSRLRSRDFDLITASWGQSLSPGNEQFEFWGSEAADRPGSQNYAGIRNPAVDKLIHRLVFATNRDDLVAATQALDRVLLWNHYVVPQWAIAYERLAYWNRFGRPTELPRLTNGFPTIWWYDAAKAQSLGLAR